MRDSVPNLRGDSELLPSAVIVSHINLLAESVSGCPVDCTNLLVQGKALLPSSNCPIVLNHADSFGQYLHDIRHQYNGPVLSQIQQ
jgi:hypothetical protein